MNGRKARELRALDPASPVPAPGQPAPIEVEMAQIPVTIASTGRPAILAIPIDTTDAELMELCSWMLMSVAKGLRERREHTAGGRIIVPRGPNGQVKPA